LPPSPSPFRAAAAAEPTTLGTPAFLPAATTKAQPVVKADPAEQFAEPLRIAAEPTPSVAPRTRIAMAGPRIPATAAPREQGPALALPPSLGEPDKIPAAAPAVTAAAPATSSVDPLGDFEDPFTEMSESEADGRGKIAPRTVVTAPAEQQPAAAPALAAPAPALAAPALKTAAPAATDSAPAAEFTAAKPAQAPKLEAPREDGAPILLPAPLESAAPQSDAAMEEDEDDEDPFESELNDDEPDVQRSIRRSSDSQPALAVPQLAAKPATPASTSDAPFFEAPVERAPSATVPLSAPKLSELNPLPAPRGEIVEAKSTPKPEEKVAERAAQPLPEDAPELTPVPQLQLDPDSTKSKMERIRERSGTVGLKGFCPVKLRDQRELVDAQPGYEAMYRGQKFLFSDIESRAKFEQNPTRYAPAAYGADVVALLRDKNVVEGTLDYAAWYKGRLYLFGSQASHDTFVEKPEDFADGESIE
jgi:YHS domain-containing protein